jgi:hypothetical protein
MDSNEVKKIVNDEIKKFVNDELDKEMKRILHTSNSKTRGEMVTSLKDALEAVVKVLWQKKDFWKVDIK